jgi:hypothetical protein
MDERTFNALVLGGGGARAGESDTMKRQDEVRSFFGWQAHSGQ